MKVEGLNWFVGLKRFAGECRTQRSIVVRDDLSMEEEMQCRIIGGSLISWLQEHGPRLIQERAVLAKLQNWAEDPFIVFTSEQPGLVAARGILSEGSDTIVFLFPDEFTEWLKDHPDPRYCWHIHMWSLFAAVDGETAKKIEKYPVSEGESLWLHKEGTMCGEHFGRGGDHLWKWDGRKPELLEEGVNQWIS